MWSCEEVLANEIQAEVSCATLGNVLRESGTHLSLFPSHSEMERQPLWLKLGQSSWTMREKQCVEDDGTREKELGSLKL